MAAYAGKTKLPRGNIMDILEGGNYMGPTRYAPAAGGISIGGGLGLLFNKLFNKKKEDEKSEEEEVEWEVWVASDIRKKFKTKKEAEEYIGGLSDEKDEYGHSEKDRASTQAAPSDKQREENKKELIRIFKEKYGYSDVNAAHAAEEVDDRWSGQYTTPTWSPTELEEGTQTAEESIEDYIKTDNVGVFEHEIYKDDETGRVGDMYRIKMKEAKDTGQSLTDVLENKKRTLHAQGGLVGINHLTRRL